MFPLQSQGHIANFCWFNTENKNYKKEKGEKEKDKPTGDEKDKNKRGVALVVQAEALSTCGNGSSSKWHIDSACTRNICSDRKRFQDFVLDGRSITAGNRKNLKVKGKGIVSLLSVVDGQKIDVTLTNVLFVPDMMCNLIASSRCRHSGNLIVKYDDKNNLTSGVIEIIEKRTSEVHIVGI